MIGKIGEFMHFHFASLLLFILTSLFTGPELVAQDNIILSDENQLNVVRWKENSGLPSMVYTMVQDYEGYVWMGSESGIYRFDGISTTLFNRHTASELTEDDCSALYIARDSSLYCGLYNGLLARYRNGRFEIIGSKKDFHNSTIKAITEDKDGGLWIATDGAGLICYRNKQFKRYGTGEGLLSQGIGCLAAGNGNEIWAGAMSGLYLIKDGKVHSYGKNDGLVWNDVSSLHYDKTGKLWIGTNQGKIITFSSGKFEQFNQPKQSEGSPINAFHQDSEGKIWVLSRDLGPLVYDPSNSTFIRIVSDPLLNSSNCTSVITDREGDVIIGTQGASIFRLRNNLVKTYTTSDGLKDNSVMAIFKDHSGDIWVSSESGKIVCYRNGKFTDMSSRFNTQDKPVFSIAGGGPDNIIWAATYGFLAGSGGKANKPFKAGQLLPNTQFRSVIESGDHSLWIGTDAGIIVVKDGSIRTIRKTDGLTDDKVLCFYEGPSGSMWAGTQEGGINIIRNGKIQSITRKDGLSDNMILCFYRDASGSMWVGTAHDGLNRIDGKTGKINQLGQFLNYPQAITHIVEDQGGKLWMGSSNGIIAVKRTDIEACIKGELTTLNIISLGEAEGIKAGSCTGAIFPAGCETSDHKIWFPTMLGIVEVDPQTIELPSYAPLAILQDLSINNESLGISNSYVIPAGAIEMEIKYTAPSFILPEDLNFRYKLEGYDQTWIEAKTRRSAFYNKLPPGDYIFQLQVMNHQGQWGDQTQLIEIHLKPYFYQTTWFLLLCILLVIGIFYFFMKYRIRQVREKELEHLVFIRTEEIRKLNEELEEKVIDRTAQLGATNAELEAFSYSVSHDLKAPVRRIEGLIAALNEDYGEKLDVTAQDFLAKISESVATMSQLIDELLKLSRIARQEIERTDVNLSSMAEKILEKHKTANPERKISFSIQQDFVVDCDARLIQIALQNLLDNAWKYSSHQMNAMITFGKVDKDGKNSIFIHDNGVGFDMHHYDKLFTPFQRLHSDDQFQGTGIGLATVKRIIQKHGGSIWAESEPGKGTTFFFTLK